LLVAVVLAAGALGHRSGEGGRAQLAQTTGGSNSNGGNSSSNNSNGSSSSNNSNGSSGSSNNSGSSGSSNGSSNSNSNGTGGPVVTTPGGGTVPGGAPVTTTPPGVSTSVPADKVKAARPTDCPSGTQPGVQCFRIKPTGDPRGARLPDGRVVVLPVGPTVNVDTGASTSNDIDQVIVVNNDNRVLSREPLNSRARQWILATLGLLLLVLVAAAVGAAIFRAGLRQGRDQT
jgi:hypothetical protein